MISTRKLVIKIGTKTRLKWTQGLHENEDGTNSCQPYIWSDEVVLPLKKGILDFKEKVGYINDFVRK